MTADPREVAARQADDSSIAGPAVLSVFRRGLMESLEMSEPRGMCRQMRVRRVN